MCQKRFRPIYLPLPKLPFHFMKQHRSGCLSRWAENWSLMQRHLPFQASPLLRARASRDSNLAASHAHFCSLWKTVKRNQFLRKWPRWLGELASLALCSSWEAATRLEEQEEGVSWGRDPGPGSCPSSPAAKVKFGTQAHFTDDPYLILLFI